jgi:15-cis-phytoene synthase
MLQSNHWERHLLDLANQALDTGAGSHQSITDQKALAKSYQTCASLTREHSKTFFLASSLLPAHKRRAAQALYAFCRISDNIVDCPEDEQAEPHHILQKLEKWRQQVISGNPSVSPAGPEEQLFEETSLAWADTRHQFHIPPGYVDQLIDGVSLDLKQQRYETFNDLSRYCYGVACTVGLMSMHITGYSSREAIPYAIRLGVALQLTNILRDVGEDWKNGRLYLPLEELHAFGIDEERIDDHVVDHRWKAFMRFQIQRACTLYSEAFPGIAMLHPDGRFAIAAAGELYQGILKKIEMNDFNVFSRRASLSSIEKLRRLPAIWMRVQQPG